MERKVRSFSPLRGDRGRDGGSILQKTKEKIELKAEDRKENEIPESGSK
ncbi:MAG: hypothetical protein OEY59_10685 [Deltaproteobacteria bacterium]|nr:hypothetical protein [Deltaproteobacteria bacterium]